jgi:hypothetical protein
MKKIMAVAVVLSGVAALNASAAFYVDGMTIAGVNEYIVRDGTVSPVPEPGVFAALSGFAALLVLGLLSRSTRN